jgi:hypothetical protein
MPEVEPVTIATLADDGLAAMRMILLNDSALQQRYCTAAEKPVSSCPHARRVESEACQSKPRRDHAACLAAIDPASDCVVCGSPRIAKTL